MAIDKNYGIKPGSYFPTGDSYNRLTAPYESSPPFIQINRDYEHDMKLDIDLLQRSTYQTKAIYNSVAGQVFGSLQQQEYVNLRHQANLMRERIKLHHRHLYDIDHRHLHVQELLFGVKINHNPEKAKRQSTLEGQLLQLEGQRCDGGQHQCLSRKLTAPPHSQTRPSNTGVPLRTSRGGLRS